MRKTVLFALGLAAATAVLASCTSGKKETQAAQAAPQPAPSSTIMQTAAPASEGPLTVEESAHVRLIARVKDINYATRKVTLEDAAKHSTSIIAGPQVERLNEVRLGDEVTAEYTVSVVAERRMATADESANPISIISMTSRSPQGTDPARVEAESVRVVTTVTAVDQAKMLITLKGPMGDTTVVHARKPENIKRLNVGDTIIITYNNATAVSLSKRAG